MAAMSRSIAVSQAVEQRRASLAAWCCHARKVGHVCGRDGARRQGQKVGKGRRHRQRQRQRQLDSVAAATDNLSTFSASSGFLRRETGAHASTRTSGDNGQFVTFFCEAAPYIERHRGKTFVITITGQDTHESNKDR